MIRLSLLCLVLLLGLTGCLLTRDPQPGELWEYRTSGTPFKSQIIQHNRVLQVKDGYVQYVDELTGRIDSCSVGWFRIGSKRIPESKATP